MDIQGNNVHYAGILYAFYGDNFFNNADCIRRAHAEDALNPLPDQLKYENNGMKAVRISIEHGYAEYSNSFKICENFREFKLHQENPHAKEQLVVCFLLSNMLNTLNGSQCTGNETFFCTTPSLEEYLELGDEMPFV